jgi:hypothetical protein
MIQSFDHPGMSFGAILFLLIICTHVKIYVWCCSLQVIVSTPG